MSDFIRTNSSIHSYGIQKISKEDIAHLLNGGVIVNTIYEWDGSEHEISIALEDYIKED